MAKFDTSLLRGTAEQKNAPFEFIEPMLASKPKDGKGVTDFSKNDWLMEEKFDGHRLIVKVEAGRSVKAWSRVGNVRELSPKIVKACLAALPSCTLDGELYLPGGTSTDVTTTETLGKLELIFFDILQVEGSNAMRELGDERRKLLQVATSKIDGVSLRLAEQYDPSEEVLHDLWNRGGEGAILKKRNAAYAAGKRSRDWVKLKKEGSAILRVTGFEEGLNGPVSRIACVSEDGIHTSVKTLNREELRQIGKNPKAFIGRHFLISYQNRTSEGSFRHPMFDRWIEKDEV